MYTQLKSCLSEKMLREFGSKQGKYTMPILYSNTPFALFRILTVSCCRTNDSSTAFWTGDKMEIGIQQAGRQCELVLWILWSMCGLAQKWGGNPLSKGILYWLSYHHSFETKAELSTVVCLTMCWISSPKKATAWQAVLLLEVTFSITRLVVILVQQHIFTWCINKH